jgi:hypothetical protein
VAGKRKATITLTEKEIQRVEQAGLDDGAESALEFLREVVKPRMDEVLSQRGCKRALEWGTDMDLRPSGPPDGHEDPCAR